MKIISIETSGKVCGVALSVDKEILIEYSASGNNMHDKFTAEYVRRCLEDYDLSISDIDAIAVSSGPGSFTGLRIGASIAKALCFKEDEKDYAPKFIAVPTLDAFIEYGMKTIDQTKFDKILAAIPAQKDTLYYKIFEKKSNNYGEIVMCSIEELSKLKIDEYLSVGPYFLENDNYQNKLSASIIAYSAMQLFRNNKFTEPGEFTPMYIQDFVVKTKRKKLVL